MKSPLILASASPRRRSLLQQIGISHQLKPVDIDETPLSHETPIAMVKRLAQEKALAAQQTMGSDRSIILAADTTVAFNDHILGKPINEKEGIATLLKLSGETHQVTTAFCILGHEKQHLEAVTSDVSFCNITLSTAETYWQTGEPADKAGSYAIQGRGAVFVERISGSYSNVVGLPLFECYQALLKFGVSE